MAASLPKGLNQLLSSAIKKWPNTREIIIITRLIQKKTDKVIFLVIMPMRIIETRNT